MSTKLLSGLVATLALGTTLVTAGQAGAAATAHDATAQGVVSSSSRVTGEAARMLRGAGPASSQAALAKYWTADAMKSARPDSQLPALRAAAKPAPTFRATAADTVQQVRGRAGSVAPAAPKTTPKPATTEQGAQAMAYSPSLPVGHSVARTAGKVFFTSAGQNYVCSGTVVNSEGKSTVWTAGHCLSSNKQWHSNWVFVPNYYNGNAPYGYWYAKQLFTTNGWFNNNSDWANDVGAAVMWRNSGGQRITDYLGGQGIAWNKPLSYQHAFGYPQAAPFNGQTLMAEQGYTYAGSPTGTIYMSNSMTGGSSGGAWLRDFNGSWGYINGHNDFKYNDLPNLMFSPYYGNQVSNLYNTVRNISS